VGLIRRFYEKLHAGQHDQALSFSQSGEDRILFFLADTVGMKSPTYLDIGAFDPWFINNTALFYRNGCTGWNVEPNHARFLKFKEQRPKDINLNLGIADRDGEATFYQMKQETLSTFSKAEAERILASDPSALKSEQQVPVLTVGSLIREHCKGKFPDILSLDVEGMDDLIVHDMQSLSSLPVIICAETAVHAGNAFGAKKTELIAAIENLGYVKYADTFINTIFLRRDQWK
jgi:FkbM family methyltransferase